MSGRLRTIGITIKLLIRDIDDLIVGGTLFVVMAITSIITLLLPTGSWGETIFAAITIVLFVGMFGYIVFDLMKDVIGSLARNVIRRYEQAQDQVRRESIKQCAVRDHGNGVGTTV